MLLWSDKLRAEQLEKFKDAEVFCMPDNISFRSLDGVLKFTMAVANHEISLGLNRESRVLMNKINRYLSKLMLVNTKYNKDEAFADYCKNMGKVLDFTTDKDEINSNVGCIKKLGDCNFKNPTIIVIRDSFYWQTDGAKENVDFKLYVEAELTKQVSRFDISIERVGMSSLSTYGCHTELLAGLRLLMSAFLRLCNTREKYKGQNLLIYDLVEINRRIEYFEATVKRIKYLVV